jgi:septation ring formation regulator EzrA
MHELVTHIEKYKRANTHLQIHKEELRERSALASKALGKIQKTQQKIEKESCALQEVLGEQESTFDDFVGEACKTYYDKELHVDLNARLRLIVELNSQIIALELERKKLFFLSRAISDCLKNCDALQILVERIKTNGGLSFLSHKERIYALVEELEELKNKFEVLNNNIHQLLNYKEYCQTDYTLKSVTNFMTPKFMKLEDYKAAIKGKGKSLIQSGITHTEKAIHQIMGPMTVTAVMESDIEMLRECSENTKTNAKGTGLHF